MKLANLTLVLSLLSPVHSWSLKEFISPIQEVLSVTQFDIPDSKILQFNKQIDDFNNKRDILIQEVEDSGIPYYTKYQDEISIPLDSYSDNFVLRLSNWNQTSSFLNEAITASRKLELKIWETSVTHKFIDIQVTQLEGTQLLEHLTQKFNDTDFESNIIILDLPQAVFQTLPQSQNDLSLEDFTDSKEIFFKSYRDLESIYAWKLKALRLSVHSESKSDKIKTFVVTGGIHAREWISTSTACYILYQLLMDYEAGNHAAVRYLENLDFLFLPVMNPDGYAFTWKTERLWRKNRQETFNPRCDGIDIDHSFDFQFTSGSESPCSDDYAGEAAFEALEAYHWDNYLNETKHSHPIHAYIDLHSYAEEVLYPYAYSCDILPRDEENLLELAYGLSQSIRLKSGLYYEVIKACRDKGADLLPSMGAGSALDYMYHNKAYWAFVLKLRDAGTHGFLLPPKHIEPVGQEIYAAIKYFASFILYYDHYV
ncbi:hypothetical protein CANINC_001990 [Pichia inconspicua]|uniref:Inactive metallocarboxypeptidase ECM14 n=1 Tax=Pichia inconspicua TaxID=52247 RepID=A0A4T0X2B1_9ASCO|nr:hypothetical protein CANINC_001990 [[Candida] inconspicua]